MGMAQPVPRFDTASYLAWEAEQFERHEFVDGEVYAMAGAGDEHNRIGGNLYVAVRSALRGTPCRTFMTGMKLYAATAGAFFYPDLFVTCDPRDFAVEANLMKRHPKLIVETLSGSTGAYDRGRKFELYRSIEGLAEVMFVQTERRQVDLFRRNPADGLWVLHPASGSEVLRLDSLDLELPLDVVYEDVLA